MEHHVDIDDLTPDAVEIVGGVKAGEAGFCGGDVRAWSTCGGRRGVERFVQAGNDLLVEIFCWFFAVENDPEEDIVCPCLRRLDNVWRDDEVVASQAEQEWNEDVSWVCSRRVLARSAGLGKWLPQAERFCYLTSAEMTLWLGG